MTSYVTQLVETGQKLSGTGFQINDEWIGCLLLAGLTEKYAPMIMAIEHSGIAITTDAIKSKLMDLDENNGGDANGAFASFRKNKVGSTGHGGNKDNRHSQTSTSMSKSKKIPRFYRCKQTGHYRNQCTVDKDSSNTKSSERKQTNAFNAVFLNGSFSRNDWYVDSGASAHLTSNENWIKNVSTEYSIKEIVVANEEKLSVKCSGDVQIATVTDDSEYDVIVKGVLCVPKLTTNLLSVSQLVKNGNRVVFTTNGCNIYNRNEQLVAVASLTNGVYKLRTSESTLATMFISVDTWHRRLGHVNSMYLNKMPDAVSGMELEKKSDISQSSCIVCCEGKQSRLPFGHAGSRSSELLGIIHSDDYKAKVENQLNRKIKTLRSDNGKEFHNRSFDDYLKKNGILHQKSNPYTPEQNGLAERFNRTIVEKAKCLLLDAKLGKEFWAEASNTAVYLHNRTVLPVLNDKTPYEIWLGRKPDIGHLRIFGSRVMVHVAKEKRLKWDKKSEKKILVGYPEDIKGYRVYCPITKRVSTSRDVIIMEEVSIPVTENKECNEESLGSVGDISSGDLEDNMDETYIDKSDVTYRPSEYESASSSESRESEHDEKPVRLRKKPERYGYSNMCADSNVEAWEDANDAGDLTVQEALEGPEKELWLSAIREELKCFSENDAWELVDAPSAGTVVKCKWVLKRKYCDKQVRYRARLVAKGFTQRPGVDYCETFSPVIRHSTLRYLFALSVQLNMDITHLDVTTAFLNGHLKEIIFMQLPECFPNVNCNKVLRLKKAIYGLKQASLAWYDRYSQGTADLVGYVDADWASNTSDRRSYTGFCFLKSGSAVSWESRKQRTVALSSCEAEYMALSEACREAIHLRRLEIEIVGFCNKVILFNDSQSALKLANGHQSYKRSKHIDVRYNFIKEVIDNEIVETKYVGTSEMPADLLTKGLPRAKHFKFMEILGLLKI
ncbi:Retrovirus-related Pol polyprotein from transposon TNT 1-94 [Eumeta japonica]|uniref:Retrovirus-related Pol polyprotein from transposon TNT 1-94 n=1 Tax=Eumeta variegata TaxID=151549 RepID=A0A4C1VSR5_EUMVA|nr:Retrovirus-related Pol polyprotein from transposon TNT 1-94 [Eumeta japonica]